MDNPEDWVRTEVATALEAKKRVIPVLVNGAEFLQAADLPEDLRALTRKQVQRLSNDRFVPETLVLAEQLKRALAEVEAERAAAAERARAEAERKAIEEAAMRAEAEADRMKAAESDAWDRIKESQDPKALRQFLAQWPDGPHGDWLGIG